MTTDYDDNTTYGTSQKENRRFDVLWTVCRPIAGTSGQCRTLHRGTVREKRNTFRYIEKLGVWTTFAGQRRISRSCESPRCENSGTLSRKIAENRENFGKVFFTETLEKQGSTGFLGEIFKNFPKFTDSLVDKVPNGTYNRHITIGNSPNQKTAYQKVCTFSTSLTANLTELDLLLVLILSERIHLTSGSSQQTKVRTHS